MAESQAKQYVGTYSEFPTDRGKITGIDLNPDFIYRKVANSLAGVIEKTDLTTKMLACGIDSDGKATQGSENDPIFGFVDQVSDDGTASSDSGGSWTTPDWVRVKVGKIAEAGYDTDEPPAINDRVTMQGNGKVKKAVALPSTDAALAAGARISNWIVIGKDTTNVTVLVMLV